MIENDPELAAIGTVCAALAGLDSEAARQRVLEYAVAKFNLQGPPKQRHVKDENASRQSDDSDLFARFNHDKPHENVWLVTAEHYSRYGTQPFVVASIKERADAVGLVVPARIDKTLEHSKKEGKLYYQKVGAGKYRVTVHGEAFLRATYGVKKGSGRPTSPQPVRPDGPG